MRRRWAAGAGKVTWRHQTGKRWLVLPLYDDRDAKVAGLERVVALSELDHDIFHAGGQKGPRLAKLAVDDELRRLRIAAFGQLLHERERVAQFGYAPKA